GDACGKRFGRVLKHASSVVVANQHSACASDVSYEYANLLLNGIANLRAKALDTDITSLAVWDGHREDAPGGASSVIKYWESHGRVPEVINLSDLAKDAHLMLKPKRVQSKNQKQVRNGDGFRQEILAVLFAD